AGSAQPALERSTRGRCLAGGHPSLLWIANPLDPAHLAQLLTRAPAKLPPVGRLVRCRHSAGLFPWLLPGIPGVVRTATRPAGDLVACLDAGSSRAAAGIWTARFNRRPAVVLRAKSLGLVRLLFRGLFRGVVFACQARVVHGSEATAPFHARLSLAAP